MFIPARVSISDLVGLGLPRFELAMAFFTIVITAVVDWCIHYRPDRILRFWSQRPARWTLLYACAFAIIFFGVFQHTQFIYFQF